VKEGFASLSDQEEREEDILDKAFDVKPVSRLGCQAEVGTRDIVVEITPESIRTWWDENPQARREAEERGEPHP
jgi:2Fe-2S ferredoxin